MDDRLSELIASLKKVYEYDERMQAVEELIGMGTDIVDHLLPILQTSVDDDPSDYTRGHIAEVLGCIGDSRVFEPLVEATETSSEFLREKAISALGSLKDSRAIGILIVYLRNHWHPDTREEAAWALANYPTSWVIRTLIRSFSDPSQIVRDAATSSLVQIGKSARDEVLKATTSDNPEIRSQAIETLAELDKHGA